MALHPPLIVPCYLCTLLSPEYRQFKDADFGQRMNPTDNDWIFPSSDVTEGPFIPKFLKRRVEGPSGLARTRELNRRKSSTYTPILPLETLVISGLSKGIHYYGCSAESLGKTFTFVVCQVSSDDSLILCTGSVNLH